jgi:GMP synthase-like glutamine amidotransferase
LFDGLTVLKTIEEVRACEIQKQDVVVFDGGTDLAPSLYNEAKSPFTDRSHATRDLHEKALFIRAQQVGAACLGVCRGAQLLCVLSGGKLIQHVTNHNRRHSIITSDREQLESDSCHHQQMWPHQTNHDLLAWAIHYAESYCEYGKDFNSAKQPEVVWFPYTRSLCIQGHPEYVEVGNRFRSYSIELVQQFILNEGAV